MKSLCNKMVGYDRKEEINNSWESFRDNALKLALLRFRSNKSKWTVKDNKLKVQHIKSYQCYQVKVKKFRILIHL